ncbi:MAG: hypothetical protein HYY37_00100 [Candidatus Aenigmarchaeota archaeon]|nr:hypothetical protein [Candidatus Aenigmarchaeota archaeon]
MASRNPAAQGQHKNLVVCNAPLPKRHKPEATKRTEVRYPFVFTHAGASGYTIVAGEHADITDGIITELSGPVYVTGVGMDSVMEPIEYSGCVTFVMRNGVYLPVIEPHHVLLRAPRDAPYVHSSISDDTFRALRAATMRSSRWLFHHLGKLYQLLDTGGTYLPLEGDHIPKEFSSYMRLMV